MKLNYSRIQKIFDKEKSIFLYFHKTFSFLRLIISILIGLSLGNLMWLYFLQWPFLTVSRLIILFIVVFTLSVIVYFSLTFLLIQIQQNNVNVKILTVFCLLFSILLFSSFGIDPPSNVLFCPESYLIITPTNDKNLLSGGYSVEVNYMKTELTTFTSGAEISFDQFSFGSDWHKKNTSMFYESGTKSKANWHGRAGDEIAITFSTGPNYGQAIINLNGVDQIIDLYSPTFEKLTVEFTISKLPLDQLTSIFSISMTIALVIFGLSLCFLSFPISRKPQRKERKLSWLFYALPLMVFWFLYLLSFWPGLLSQDSINQWDQVINFQFRSAHPPFHTILIWLASLLWKTPTTFIALQIIVQAVTIAWGLKTFQDLGVSRWVNWIIVAIFSISPVISMMMITLWKDIPYSTTLVILSIMMIKIVFSDGKWLKNPSSWISLGIVSAMASLFRHNGLAVAILLFPVLIIFYNKLVRFSFYSLGVFLAFFSLINYVLFPIVEVEKEPGFSNISFLHHISAHIYNGTPRTQSEERYLGSLLPLDEWKQKYDPCTVNTIMFHEDFNIQKFFFQEISQPRKIIIAQFLRRPQVSFRHIITSGSLVWKINPVCGMYYSPFDKYAYEMEPYWQVKWVIKNLIGLEEDSKLPGLQNILGNIFLKTKEMWIFWRPAIYLYVVVFIISIVSLKFNSRRYLLIGVPVFLQSLILTAVNISQDFRYQFSVYMIGIFFIGLLFLPKKERK